MSGSVQLRLQRIPDILLSLAETLSVDSHIKDNAKQLVEKLAGTCQQFDTMICNEFKDVFLQMKILFTTMNADDVNIPKLKMALLNGSCAIVSIRDKLMAIQGDVHQDIETCRETVKNKKGEVAVLDIEITLMEQEVRLLQGEISELKNEARSLADSAKRKYDEAVEAKRSAEKHNLVGGLGLAEAFTGLLRATVIGGGSLVATAIGVAVAGASLKEASELMKRYIRDKEKSKEKDDEATKLQSAANTKQQTINEKRNKITTANSDISK
ncbi:uncharacterized protein LOC127849321 [Dreissena polymorpha]|uniref:uncharacterized protein LOC127849321 n=1 Tax=Dreissena polymorpha TaxID=45954 RepID=UPI0022645E10|nr:uncharacterized protein LOC127849321 [Dreissena polymorpha]